MPRGGEEVFLGFGAFSDQGTDFTPLGGPFIENFQGVPRGPTIEPSDSGQYGAVAALVPAGLRAGHRVRLLLRQLPQQAAAHQRPHRHAGRPRQFARHADRRHRDGAGPRIRASARRRRLAPLRRANRRARPRRRSANARATRPLETAAGYATIAGNTALGGGNVTAQATALATHEYAQTARYFTEYPEDIQLFGVSFNTQLGTTGIALQGEVSYRHGRAAAVRRRRGPVRGADAVRGGRARGAGHRDAGRPARRRCRRSRAAASSAPTVPDQVVQGWDVFDVWQGQMTATKAFPPMLGASQLVAVIEAGMTHVDSMPSKTDGRPERAGPALQRAGHLRLRQRRARRPAFRRGRAARTASPTRIPGAIAWRCGSTT